MRQRRCGQAGRGRAVACAAPLQVPFPSSSVALLALLVRPRCALAAVLSLSVRGWCVAAACTPVHAKSEARRLIGPGNLSLLYRQRWARGQRELTKRITPVCCLARRSTDELGKPLFAPFAAVFRFPFSAGNRRDGANALLTLSIHRAGVSQLQSPVCWEGGKREGKTRGAGGGLALLETFECRGPAPTPTLRRHCRALGCVHPGSCRSRRKRDGAEPRMHRAWNWKGFCFRVPLSNVNLVFVFFDASLFFSSASGAEMNGLADEDAAGIALPHCKSLRGQLDLHAYHWEIRLFQCGRKVGKAN